MRTYGRLEMGAGGYVIEAEPHVKMILRRVFASATHARGSRFISLGDTLANAEQLAWFLQRYPMTSQGEALAHLKERAELSLRLRTEADDVMAGRMAPMEIATKLPLRDYQRQAVQLGMLRKRLLCGDDLGLGKTAVGLGMLAAGANPAIIVCQTHLQKQWMDEAHKFCRHCWPHIAKKASPYKLPTHNVLILPYSKLAGWADHLKDYRLVIFDEAQELRRNGTDKYSAAKAIADGCEYAIGLTATPVYNYGDEIFNVIDVIDRGALGERSEFLAEWCQGYGMHHTVEDPVALGGFLAEQRIFLRRRRADVGRELPPVTRLSQEIEHDPKKLAEATAKGLQLAKAVLEGEFMQRGMAARELDALMRQQTGIAKAPYVAAYVADLVRAGEKVVLLGWHREVYDVWQKVLLQNGIRSVLYTGSESTNQKNASVDAFIHGDANVIMLSLRSGAGLNGLQEVASIMVFGELDWSPQVHEQCIGRLQRDGQKGNVTAVFLVSEGGSDPTIAGVLGLKREQSEGIVNPDLAQAEDVIGEQAAESRVSSMAKDLLKQYAAA